MTNVTLDEWRNAQALHKISMGYFIPRDGLEKWAKPVTETLKLNMDFALFVESGRYSFAILVKHQNRLLVEAHRRWREGTIQHEVAETFELKEALSWIKQQ